MPETKTAKTPEARKTFTAGAVSGAGDEPEKSKSAVTMVVGTLAAGIGLGLIALFGRPRV